VAIGLSLLYLGTALFVTVAIESIEGIWSSRGRMLKQSLEALLGRDGLTTLVSKHPAFQGIEEKIRSYVDPIVVAQTLLQTAESLPPESAAKRAIDQLRSDYGNKAEEVTNALALWADRSLSMLGESYKRWKQLWSFGIGLALAVLFNVDTVGVTARLYQDKDLRDSVAATATELVRKASPELLARCQRLDLAALKADAECTPLGDVVQALARRDGTFGQVPIGWRSWSQVVEASGAQWLLRGAGWLLTALAVSVGAPFWFDLLNRFVNLRAGQRKPEGPAAVKP